MFNAVSFFLILNLSPTAGGTSGYKHTERFRVSLTPLRGVTGDKNPISGREFSPEFIAAQKQDKFGSNNPQYGVVKSSQTIAKLTKPVYVYDATTCELLGVYSTVNCAKHFKIGKDRLTKYLANGLPFKGRIYRRIEMKNE
jgi:hypothetical protein